MPPPLMSASRLPPRTRIAALLWSRRYALPHAVRAAGAASPSAAYDGGATRRGMAEDDGDGGVKVGADARRGRPGGGRAETSSGRSRPCRTMGAPGGAGTQELWLQDDVDKRRGADGTAAAAKDPNGRRERSGTEGVARGQAAKGSTMPLGREWVIHAHNHKLPCLNYPFSNTVAGAGVLDH